MTAEDRLARVEALLPLPDAVPAMRVALIDGFVLADVRAYGALSARTDTLFQAGSISKAVAALAALRLVDTGTLELDADVGETLVSWTAPPGITLRQLLGHTAGLTVESFPGYARGDPLPSVAEILDGRAPATNPPVRTEGAGAYRYSGGGYVVVQALLEDATGTPLADLARELVFDPLGMADSTFEQPLGEASEARAAQGHQGGEAVEGGWHVYPELAAAGLWTTAADLARLAAALQSALTGRRGPVTRETAELMVVPHAEVPETEELATLRSLGVEPPDHVGLGLFLAGPPDRRRFGHLGGAAGFFAALDASLDDGTGAVVMTNAGAHPVLFRALVALTAG